MMTSVEPASLAVSAEPLLSGRRLSHLLDSRAAGPAALRGSVLRTGAYVGGILLSLISARVLIGHLGVQISAVTSPS